MSWIDKPAYKLIKDLVEKAAKKEKEPEAQIELTPSMQTWMEHEYYSCQCGSQFVPGHENAHSYWCPKYNQETKVRQ